MSELEQAIRELWNRADREAFALQDAGRLEEARAVSQAAAAIRTAQSELTAALERCRAVGALT